MSERGIYVASRVKHAEMWRARRYEQRLPIVSSWIDEAGEGETADFAELWRRIGREVTSASCLLLYATPDCFPLKGALVEVGMAMAAGVRVVACLPGVELDGRTLRPVGSWLHAATRIDSLDRAIDAALAYSRTPPPTPQPERDPRTDPHVGDVKLYGDDPEEKYPWTWCTTSSFQQWQEETHAKGDQWFTREAWAARQKEKGK